MSSNPPELHIRDVRDADLAAVHTINEAAAPHVNSISLDRFQGFTHEVGTQETGGGAKTVSLMAVELNAPG